MQLHLTTRQGTPLSDPARLSPGEQPLRPEEAIGFFFSLAHRQAILALGEAGGALRLDDGPAIPCRARIIGSRLAVEILIDQVVLDTDTTPLSALLSLDAPDEEADAETALAEDIEAGYPRGRLYVAVPGLPPSTGGTARVTAARDLPESEAADAVVRIEGTGRDWPCFLLSTTIHGSVSDALAEGVHVIALPSAPLQK